MPEKGESFAEQKAAMDSALKEADSALCSAEESVKGWPSLMAEIGTELTPALRTASTRLIAETRSLGRRDYLKGLLKERKSLAGLRGITWRDRRALYARLWDVVVQPYIAALRLGVWLWEHRQQLFRALGLAAGAILLVTAAMLVIEHRGEILDILRSLWELMRR